MNNFINKGWLVIQNAEQKLPHKELSLISVWKSKVEWSYINSSKIIEILF
jgi:hypothetical protein